MGEFEKFRQTDWRKVGLVIPLLQTDLLKETYPLIFITDFYSDWNQRAESSLVEWIKIYFPVVSSPLFIIIAESPRTLKVTPITKNK